MRGQALSSLLTDYRVETNASSNPAHTAGARDAQVSAIRKTQEWLWRRHDWPHLRVFRYIDLQDGERYYSSRQAMKEDGSAAIDLGFERLEVLEVRDGGRWRELRFGIGAADYAHIDSELDARQDPACAWALREGEMFEVWPTPASNAASDLEGRLRLTGIRDLRPLVADGDRADLDDDLIVKYAAANALARAGAKNAQIVLDQAKSIEADLTANFAKCKTFSLAGGGPVAQRTSRFPPTVHYRTVPSGS